MDRLTFYNDFGAVSTRGYEISISKLAAYEDTGITPEQIREIDKLYLEKCQEVNKLKAGRWIPCNEKMPGCEQEVLIQTERGTITTAMYEDGKMADEDSMWHWNEIDYDYDEETDTNYIPEGWWEYKHFAPDDVYNYDVDENVVAWQPLPPKYEPAEQDTGRVEAAKQMGFLK